MPVQYIIFESHISKVISGSIPEFTSGTPLKSPAIISRRIISISFALTALVSKSMRSYTCIDDARKMEVAPQKQRDSTLTVSWSRISRRWSQVFLQRLRSLSYAVGCEMNIECNWILYGLFILWGLCEVLPSWALMAGKIADAFSRLASAWGPCWYNCGDITKLFTKVYLRWKPSSSCLNDNSKSNPSHIASESALRAWSLCTKVDLDTIHHKALQNACRAIIEVSWPSGLLSALKAIRCLT